MLIGLGRFTVRWRKAILVGAAVFVVASFVIAGGVADKLTAGGFADPHSESERAAAILQREFGSLDPNVVLLVTAKHGTVDDAAVAAAGTKITQELSDKLGNTVASYWSLGNAPPLASKNHTQALVLGVITGGDDHVDDVIKVLSPEFTRDNATVKVAVGGRAEVFRQVGETIKSDLSRAESIALPITLVLLVIVFGSLIAAGLPLLVGIVAIAGSFLVLYGVASVTDVSVYSLNLTTALGLGLAIDYSLFIVSRFREELHNGLEPHDAVVRTVATAGRTVAGSALDGRGVAHRAVAVPARVPPLVRVRRNRGRDPRRARCGGRAPRDARGARHQGELGAHLPSPRAQAGRRRGLAPRRDDGDATADPDRDRRHPPPAAARRAVPAPGHRAPGRPRPAAEPVQSPGAGSDPRRLHVDRSRRVAGRGAGARRPAGPHRGDLGLRRRALEAARRGPGRRAHRAATSTASRSRDRARSPRASRPTRARG